MMGLFSQELEVGDEVRVIYSGQEGVIVDKDGKYYTVSLNGGTYSEDYTKDQIERI